jgi:hypothetical protein
MNDSSSGRDFSGGQDLVSFMGKCARHVNYGAGLRLVGSGDAVDNWNALPLGCLGGEL